MKILIVDDSKAMQNIVTKALKAIGFDNVEYFYGKDGEEGLTIAIEHEPTIAICDLHMPGMSGIELVETMRRKGLPTKAGIVSIEKNQKYIDAAQMAGASFFLQKPFTNQQLFDTIVSSTKINPFRLERKSTAKQLILPDQRLLEALFTHLLNEEVSLQPAQIVDFDADQLPYIVCSFENQQHQLRVHFGASNRMVNFIASKMRFITYQTAVEQLAAFTFDTTTLKACQNVMGVLALLIHAFQPEEKLRANEVYITETGAQTAHRVQQSLRNMHDGLQLYQLVGVAPEFEGGVLAIGPM